MATERPKKDLQRNSALRKCFQALVDRKQVNITMDTIKLMLKHELQVNLDGLDENLQNVLPFMLIVNIRNWPGWQKSKEYYSGKLNFREWFLKFRQYVILRLSFIIKNGYKEVIDEINNEKTRKKNEEKPSKEKGIQTDHLSLKEEAPFCINIECSPKILKSLVFIDKADDILLSHNTENNSKKVVPTFRQLINWPHVGVRFTSSNLSFKRFNRPEVCRTLNLGFNRIKLDQLNFIEEIKIVNPKLPQKSYSLSLLWAYSYQLMELLRRFDKEIYSKHLDHIEILLEEFFKDIKDWELNHSVASNTSVLFNIGNGCFLRSKRAIMENPHQRGITPEIIYSETFIPKMETELVFFGDSQTSSTSDVSFVFLDTLKKGLEAGSVDPKLQAPTLTYICLFCNITFNNYVEILQHLLPEVHGPESNLVCPKCQKSCTMNSLAGSRWKHVCVKNN